MFGFAIDPRLERQGGSLKCLKTTSPFDEIAE
jgi:hypothetical protein